MTIPAPQKSHNQRFVSRNKSNQEISLKLSVDYIKHHTAVAFPAVIFVKQDISSISYTISSKKLPDIQEAVINAN